MKNVFNALVRVLRQRWLHSLLLVLALAAAIWFIGPLLTIAEQRLWETPASRLLTICIVLLSWGVMLLVSERRQRADAASPSLEQVPEPALLHAVEHAQTVLRKRFKEAVHKPA